MGSPSKCCTKCNKLKPAKAFPLGRGLCKSCANDYFRAWKLTPAGIRSLAETKASRKQPNKTAVLEARIARDTKTLEILKEQVKAREDILERTKARLIDALKAPAPKAREVSVRPVRPLTRAQIRAREIDEEIRDRRRAGETFRATAWTGTQQESPFGRNQY